MADPIVFHVWEQGRTEDFHRFSAKSPAQAAEAYGEMFADDGSIRVGEAWTVCVRAPDGIVTTWECKVEIRVLVRAVGP